MEQKYTNSVFLDSGAPYLYNRLSRVSDNSHTMGTGFKNRKFDNFDYIEKAEYKEYFDSYIQFLLDNKDTITVYSNLDVINNAKLTWRNQKIMERAGLNPLPVYHLGSDIKFLYRYLDNYEYIALGGLVPNPTNVLIPILDRLFTKHLVDNGGMPTHKLHGFACTSYRLMVRYPWYSVDSTTWLKNGSFGRILVPPLRQNKWVYDEQFYIVKVSNRKTNVSHLKVEQTERPIDNVFLRYIEEKGFTLGSSDLHYEKSSYVLKEGETFTEKVTEKTKKVLVETITERGLCNDDTLRCDLNAEYFVDLADNLPTWPWAFHVNQQKTLL